MLPKELKRLQEIFDDNGYPSDLIRRFIHDGGANRQRVPATHEKTSSSLTTEATTKTSPQQELDKEPDQQKKLKDVTICLPWIGQISMSHSRDIRNTVKVAFPTANPRVVFTTKKAFSGRNKDVLPTTACSNVIYEYTCHCKCTYVGKTTQCLSERIQQHLPSKLFTETPDLKKSTADSAITKHLKSSPDCRAVGLKLRKCFKILARARKRTFGHLDVLEAVFINRLKPSLCLQKENTQHLHLR